MPGLAWPEQRQYNFPNSYIIRKLAEQSGSLAATDSVPSRRPSFVQRKIMMGALIEGETIAKKEGERQRNRERERIDEKQKLWEVELQRGTATV